MAEVFIKTFRAVSGSSFVFFKSNETEPVGITNKTVISQDFNPSSIPIDPSAATVIWKWNGTDTSQFIQTPIASQGITSSLLKAVSNSFSPTGKALEITGSIIDAAANDFVAYQINQQFTASNYIIEYTVGDVGPKSGGTNEGFGGPFFIGAGSGSNFHAVGFGTLGVDNTARRFLCQTGTLNKISTDSAGGIVEPAIIQLEIRSEKLSGSLPNFEVHISDFGTTSESSTYFDKTSFPNPLTSSWKPLTINKIGLLVGADDAGTDNPALQILTMVIKTNPAGIA